MLSSTFDPFYSFGGGLLDPFSDWDIAFPVGNWPSRRQRRRPQRQTIGQQGQTPPGTVTQQQGGEATTGTTGALAPWGGDDIGILDFDRLLSEPLSVSLVDRDKEYLLQVAQPPELRKKDLHVEVNNGVLTVSGSREIEERGRRRIIAYHRSMTLPDNVNADQIEAKYNPDGTLEIVLPKTQGTQRKRINIQGAETTKQEEKEESGKDQQMRGGEDKEKSKEKGTEPSQQQQASMKMDTGAQQGSTGGRQVPVGGR